MGSGPNKLILYILNLQIWPPKFDQAIKKSKFNFVVEYPTCMSIKRFLTGKMALPCQNLIYCLRLNINFVLPGTHLYTYKSLISPLPTFKIHFLTFRFAILTPASLSEFDLLPPFNQKRPKTIQNGAFSEFSYFRMFLDVFF